MTLIDDLRQRLMAWDEEAQTLRDQLKKLDELMAHARALIEEEKSRLPQSKAVQAEPVGAKPTVNSVIEELISHGNEIRFTELRDQVREKVFPNKDPLTVGKSVSAALNRAVAKGSIAQIARGVYKLSRRQGVDSQPVSKDGEGEKRA